MRNRLSFAFPIVILVLVGCGTKDESASVDAASTDAPASGGGVAPTGIGAAGGMTPVAGGESMGGVGSAATERARSIAGKSSAGPADGGEGGE